MSAIGWLHALLRGRVRGALGALAPCLALLAGAPAPNIVQVATGGEQSCALDDTGQVWCWGANWGRLGDGTADSRLTPVHVRRVSDATAIAGGGGHSCAVRSFGRVSCWGLNSRGQFGDGTTRRRLTGC